MAQVERELDVEHDEVSAEWRRDLYRALDAQAHRKLSTKFAWTFRTFLGMTLHEIVVLTAWPWRRWRKMNKYDREEIVFFSSIGAAIVVIFAAALLFIPVSNTHHTAQRARQTELQTIRREQIQVRREQNTLERELLTVLRRDRGGHHDR